MILSIGSVGIDTIKTPFGKVNEALGGSGTHFSMSSSFFSKVSLIAVVGNDFPKRHIQLLESRGVDLSGLQVTNGKTFRWSGEYTLDLNNPNTIFTKLNVFSEFNPVIPNRFRSYPYVFLGNIDPDLQLYVLRQMNSPKIIACDTIKLWIQNKAKRLKSVIKKSDIFFLNDSEAREFTGEYNLKKAAQYLLSLGPKYIVIKKGEHGVLLFSKDSVFISPALLLENIFDPTGAGDSFAGGFIGYVSKKKSHSASVMKQAIIYGTIMASFCVEGFGVKRLAGLKSREITKRFNEFKRVTQF